ncbi:MAG: TetR/AcrR family transcriptional regulator [Sulfuriferula sp.]
MVERRLSPTGQPSARFIIDRREQILDAAQDIVQRGGYTSFGYRELSLVVGIRKASIHYHFPKKDDLILALVKRYTENFVGALDLIVNVCKSPTEQLNAYFLLFENTLAESNNEKCCLAGVMGTEIGALPVFVREEILRFCMTNQLWLAALIERGVGEGVFNSSVLSSTLAQLMFSALEGAMMLSRLHNSSHYLHGVVEQLRGLIFIDSKSYLSVVDRSR